MQTDGRQRALNWAPPAPDELEALRIQLRQELAAGPTVDGVPVTRVRPWLWSAQTSGGVALTDAGSSSGYELRLSRYAAPVGDSAAHS